MSKSYAIVMALIVGVCISIQAPINAGLGKIMPAKTAALHSFLTATIILVLMNVFSGELSMYGNITKIHPVYWTGGLLGLGIVFLTIKVIPVLGMSTAFSIFVAVQLIMSIFIDHFGILGVPRSPVSILKVVGVVLLFISVRLILK
ncbi:MAG: DMT family transporter [Firmicutes bacterium]|nr:DMT family transporter [Bacillota bacterium]